MNKLFLPVCLLIAGYTSAVSETLKSLSAQEPTKAKCEKLPTDDKAALDDYCVELEAFSQEVNQKLLNIAAKHKKGSEVLKEVIGADQLAAQVQLVPVNTQAADFMDFDNDDIFDDADDVRMVS